MCTYSYACLYRRSHTCLYTNPSKLWIQYIDASHGVGRRCSDGNVIVAGRLLGYPITKISISDIHTMSAYMYLSMFTHMSKHMSLGISNVQ